MGLEVNDVRLGHAVEPALKPLESLLRAVCLAGGAFHEEPELIDVHVGNSKTTADGNDRLAEWIRTVDCESWRTDCETELMLDFENGAFVELKPGFAPSPSGGGILLLQQEEGDNGYLIVCGYVPSLDSPNRQDATALVTICGMRQSVFGYPNEESFWFDGRGELGAGFYELCGSKWAANIIAYNMRTYGASSPEWQPAGPYWNGRHFFVGSKDASAQFLAQGLRVETFTEIPFRAVREEALRRLDQWGRGDDLLTPSGGQHVWLYPDGPE